MTATVGWRGPVTCGLTGSLCIHWFSAAARFNTAMHCSLARWPATAPSGAQWRRRVHRRAKVLGSGTSTFPRKKLCLCERAGPAGRRTTKPGRVGRHLAAQPEEEWKERLSKRPALCWSARLAENGRRKLTKHRHRLDPLRNQTGGEAC